jgi:hypothetical protein
LKNNLGKKKVIKTTPQKGHEHYLLCWPAGVKNSEIAKSTMTGGLGTMRYMAPEVLGDLGLREIPGRVSVAGSNYIDGKKCDVCAAAVLYSEILKPYGLAGESPCPHLPLAVLVAVVHGNYRPPLSEAVPLLSAALLRRMWDAGPSVRPSFSTVLAELGLERHQDPVCAVGFAK